MGLGMFFYEMAVITLAFLIGGVVLRSSRPDQRMTPIEVRETQERW